MSGFSDLLTLKQIAFFNSNNEDPVTAFAGTPDGEVLFGTSKGKIIRCAMQNDELVFRKGISLSTNPVKQLVPIPNKDLLLVAHEKSLVHLERSNLSPLAKTGDGTIECLSINRQMKHPDILIFAIATNRKQIVVCKGMSTAEGMNVEIIEKISTSANARRLCFDGKGLCYATEDRYYVIDMAAQPRTHHSLMETPPNSHIVSIDQGQFAICGVDGLVVFCDSSGNGCRIPISLNMTITDMLFSNSMLYASSGSKIVVQNLNEEGLKFSIACADLHRITFASERLVLVTSDKRVKEFALADDFNSKIRDLLKEDVEHGLRVVSTIRGLFPPDDNTSLLTDETLYSYAIELLDSGEFEKGFEIILQTRCDPSSILSRIQRLNAKTSEPMWDVELEGVREFLDRLLRSENFSNHAWSIRRYLIRAKILSSELSRNDIDVDFLQDQDLIDWMFANDLHALLAELCFEYELTSMAIDVWEKYVADHETTLKAEDLEPFRARLCAIATEKSNLGLIKRALTWLTPRMPGLSMSIVRQLSTLIDLDWAVDNFKAYPRLLLDFLEEQQDSKSNQDLNRHLVRTYTEALEKDGGDWKIRHSFRGFLMAIPYDEQIEASIPNEFAIEKRLYGTKLENVEESLKRLIKEDLDAAELLYIKYGSQRADLIHLLVEKYLEEEKRGNPMHQRFAQFLSQIRPFPGIERVIADLPASYLTRDMIALFQNSIEECAQSRANLELRSAIDRLTRERELDRKRQAQYSCVRYDANDSCDLCKSTLDDESISFLHNNPVHTRCLRRL